MGLSGIKQLYLGDKQIGEAKNCTISCDTASNDSLDLSNVVFSLSFYATMDNPTYLLAFRLRYGVSDWLEWRDGLFKRFWYEYISKPVWQSVDEEIARYEEEYSKQMNNG